MPNVLLTQQCVRSCPYCFAKKYMSGLTPKNILSWENLIYIADFLEVSGERNLSLLGGEPTLHPHFTDFVIYLLERNFNIRVFTSGIMTDNVLEKMIFILHGLPDSRLSFICNLNDPQKTYSSFAEVESVKRFLKAFGPRIVPGFNIYRCDFNIDFLLQYINNFGLKRTIRIGIAHPIPGKKNRFMSLDEIDIVIERLFSYTALFERLHIKPGLDCGFPICRFKDSQLAWLYRYTGGGSRFGCAPAIDIGPDMMVWSCFPLLAFHNRSFFEFDTLQDVVGFYERKMKIIRMEVGGVFEECDDCLFREDGICAGGCLGHILSHFKDEARVRVSEIYG